MIAIHALNYLPTSHSPQDPEYTFCRLRIPQVGRPAEPAPRRIAITPPPIPALTSRLPDIPLPSIPPHIPLQPFHFISPIPHHRRRIPICIPVPLPLIAPDAYQRQQRRRITPHLRKRQYMVNSPSLTIPPDAIPPTAFTATPLLLAKNSNNFPLTEPPPPRHYTTPSINIIPTQRPPNPTSAPSVTSVVKPLPT